jgi:hypothetical protein
VCWRRWGQQGVAAPLRTTIASILYYREGIFARDAYVVDAMRRRDGREGVGFQTSCLDLLYLSALNSNSRLCYKLVGVCFRSLKRTAHSKIAP